MHPSKPTAVDAKKNPKVPSDATVVKTKSEATVGEVCSLAADASHWEGDRRQVRMNMQLSS